jgi:hypothetical protein
MFEEDESDEEGDVSTEEQRLPALDKMNFDYKVISEDKETITVFLKLKPGNEKEPQKNVAGTMVSKLLTFVEFFSNVLL